MVAAKKRRAHCLLGVIVASLFSLSATPQDSTIPIEEAKPPLHSALEWTATLEIPGPGQWEFFTFSRDYRVAHFATRRMATRKGTVATVWFRNEERDVKETMSSASRVQFDCVDQTIWTLTTIHYTRNDLDGDATTYDGAAKPSPIMPGTIAESMMTWACDATKSKPQQKPSAAAQPTK